VEGDIQSTGLPATSAFAPASSRGNTRLRTYSATRPSAPCFLRRASQISEIGIFGDPNDLNQLATFLRCDVTVLEAYRAEAAARNLERAGLLRWFTFELPKVALQ
jgi:hypothetical protein